MIFNAGHPFFVIFFVHFRLFSLFSPLFIAPITAYTIDTNREFQCPNMELSSIAGYTDSSGSYIKTPVYLGPVFTCAVAKMSNMTFYFSPASLGLGADYKMELSPTTWTMFYGMNANVEMHFNDRKLNSTMMGLSALPLKTPPTTVVFANLDSVDQKIILPSIFVTVPTTVGRDMTSSIIGTTVLSITFLAMVAGFRSLSVG